MDPHGSLLVQPNERGRGGEEGGLSAFGARGRVHQQCTRVPGEQPLHTWRNVDWGLEGEEEIKQEYIYTCRAYGKQVDMVYLLSTS